MVQSIILRTIDYHISSRWDEVYFLQSVLRLRGYDVPIDGIWKKGDATDKALKHFQEFVGLNPNGVVDGKTWDKLLDRY